MSKTTEQRTAQSGVGDASPAWWLGYVPANVEVETYKDMEDYRAHWSENRAHSIGGSDAGVLMGLSLWKTPVQLWLEKTGKAPQTELDANSWPLWFGHHAETILLDWYKLQHPEQDVYSGTFYTLREKSAAVHANLDGVIMPDDEHETPGVLEFKTSRSWSMWHDENGDVIIPPAYLAQVDHYMMLTHWDWARFVVMVGGYEPFEITVNRDAEREAALVKAETGFIMAVNYPDMWQPEPVNAEDIALLYPEPGEKLETVPESEVDDFTKTARKLKTLRETMKANKQEAERLNNALAVMVGENAGLEHDGLRVTLGTRAGKRSKTVKISED